MVFKRLLIGIFAAFLFFLSFVAISQEAPQPVPKTQWFHSVEHAPDNCEIKGIKLTECKVKVVYEYNSPTFKVRVVGSGETNWDLTVRYVTNSITSNLCGQWKIVSSSEDFTVAFVEYGEDFTVCILSYD
jgi:hypothetical protein